MIREILRIENDDMLSLRLVSILLKSVHLQRCLGGQQGVKSFVDANLNKLLSLSNDGKMSYLGSGMRGDAFELQDGNILKLEAENTITSTHGVPEHEKWLNAFHNNNKYAKHFPMIYDAGVLTKGSPTRVFLASWKN